MEPTNKKENDKVGTFFSYLKTKYYNISYQAKQTNNDELVALVTRGPKGVLLPNPQVTLLDR